MSSVYRGSFAAQSQRYEERWSPISGLTRDMEWSGLHEGNMRILAQAVANSGCAYQLHRQFGVFHLVATDTSGEITIDTWEIGQNENVVSSLLNPLNRAAMPQTYLDLIGRAARDNSTIAEAAAALTEDTGITYPTTITDNAAAIRLWTRLAAGETGFYRSLYVLRHTTNVSNRYRRNISDIYVGRIYTVAQLLAETQDATLWVYPLPGRLAYKIEQAANDAIAEFGTTANYLWGWLKSASPESSAANNRVNIVTEYKFFQWSTDEYLVV